MCLVINGLSQSTRPYNRVSIIFFVKVYSKKDIFSKKKTNRNMNLIDHASCLGGYILIQSYHSGWKEKKHGNIKISNSLLLINWVNNRKRSKSE